MSHTDVYFSMLGVSQATAKFWIPGMSITVQSVLDNHVYNQSSMAAEVWKVTWQQESMSFQRVIKLEVDSHLTCLTDCRNGIYVRRMESKEAITLCGWSETC